MNFQNAEIAELFDQAKPWCHPEYPFLDAHYSPSSRMPAIDYTPFIAGWLQNQKYEAVSELLGYLINGSSIRDTIVGDWINTKPITWLGLPIEAIYEIQAIGLSISRQAIDRSINKDSLAYFAIRLIAARLSLHQGMIDEVHKVQGVPSTTPESDEDENDPDSGIGRLLETKIRLAYGLRQWQDGKSEGALMAFPAQELVCFGQGNETPEWLDIWDGIAAQLGDETTASKARKTGRMVARKYDPIGVKLSDFGRPYPPFKLDSDMSIMDVGYEEAVELGVVKAHGTGVLGKPRIVKAVESPCGAFDQKEFAPRSERLNSLEEPLGQEALAIDRLALIPPMTRLVVIDYFKRTWAQGQMKFSMGYTEREYGCCADWNKHYVQWLNFFEPPAKLEDVPHSLKKDQIRARLEASGMVVKKLASRDNLLALAAEQPGLLASMLGELCPESCVVKQDWKTPLEAWLARYDRMLDVASEIYKSLLLQQMQF